MGSGGCYGLQAAAGDVAAGVLGRSLATAGIGRQTIEQGEELGVVEQEEGRCGRATSRA